MPSFNIDDFTSKFTKGGALASLFECTLTGGQGTSNASAIGDFKFLCKGVSFPASAITAATVTYMGRSINIPGNRDAGQITTSIYNDEMMEIRNYLESCMERLNSHKSNKRESGLEGINSYTGTMQVKQISKDSSDFPKTYEFMNVWPSSTGEIALSWDTNDIQAFDVTWEYNYWRSPDSDVGM